MKKTIAAFAIAALFPAFASAGPLISSSLEWTYNHASTPNAPGQASEIPAFDAKTNTLWVAGVAGVDVLDARTGNLVRHIDTTAYGAINSVAIHNGVAAFALEDRNVRTNPGLVQFYDTGSLSLTGSVAVGALPDMLAFTRDGSRLLVANEGTPSTYGTRTGTSVPFTFGNAANDPKGSVSIIDMNSRTVIATPDFSGVAQTGSHLRTNTGMDFEPEYIAISADGSKAYVSLQEANGMAILDLASNRFEKIVGLGVKDFSLPGNSIDPRNDGTVSFGSHAVKGFYMPDSLATYQVAGQTYVVMANEGDFREDDGDRSSAGNATFGTTGILSNLRIANTDSSPGDLYIAGARSFSIRDVDGNLVYDSGDLLDRKAHEKGVYDDARSRDKGVEPEGVTILEIGGRTLVFVGLERTTKSAIAIFDITDPAAVSYVDMLISEDDLSPEGLVAFSRGGQYFLAVANEVSNTTSLFRLNTVPEPGSVALLLGGLLAAGIARRKR
jgi:hypothetical protein